MRGKISGILIGSVVLGSISLAQPVSADAGDAVSSFASPNTQPGGLAWDGTYLWNADTTPGNLKIYKLDTAGNVISSFAPPSTWPEGLGWDGTYLWNADSSLGVLKIYKLDTAGNVISSFSSPGNLPAGLAWDGTYLWNADYGTDKIYKLDTAGTVISSFASPSTNPRGLAWDGTYLWNADTATDKIYKLDTAGTVISSFDSPSTNPTGLAWDGTYLWLADSNTNKIYKIDPSTAPTLTSGSVAPSSGEWGTTFRYEVTYTDNDGDFPATGYPKVYIDGNAAAMIEKDSTDDNVKDGKVYKYDWVPTSADIGSHDFYFCTEDLYADNARDPATGTRSGPTVTKQFTSLTCSVDDNTPTPGQTITFSGYLKDPNLSGVSGKTITLYKDLSNTGLTDTTDSNGYYSISIVTPSALETSYYYTSFAEGTLYLSSQSSSISVTTALPNQPPTLSNGSVSPASGVAGTDFVFEVTYTDADGDAPAYVKVYVDNTEHMMDFVSGDYTTGALYRYTWSPTSADIGMHNYHFETSDGTDTDREPITGTYSGPEVMEGEGIIEEFMKQPLLLLGIVIVCVIVIVIFMRK